MAFSDQNDLRFFLANGLLARALGPLGPLILFLRLVIFFRAVALRIIPTLEFWTRHGHMSFMFSSENHCQIGVLLGVSSDGLASGKRSTGAIERTGTNILTS